MKRKNFGKVVKSLRMEQFDINRGRSWTQAKLAEESNLSEDIIGKIERGKKANLNDIVVPLANALKLSTLERREFFAAATENTPQDISAGLVSPKQAFDHAWQGLSRTHMPAYLFDPLYDLVGANHSAMALHGLSSEDLNAMAQSEIGCNLMTLFFAKESALRTAMKDKWEDIATANINQFRYMVLRYRHTKRFDVLLNQLSKLPDFSRLWTATCANANDYYSQMRFYIYPHAIHNDIDYQTTLSAIVTAIGSLYITTFEPCNNYTNDLFRTLSSQQNPPCTVMPWPNIEIMQS